MNFVPLEHLPYQPSGVAELFFFGLAVNTPLLVMAAYFGVYGIQGLRQHRHNFAFSAILAAFTIYSFVGVYPLMVASAILAVAIIIEGVLAIESIVAAALLMFYWGISATGIVFGVFPHLRNGS